MFYGGKSKIAHLYPKPRHGIIIEPFAGAASYSLLYYDKEIILNEADVRVYSIWKFLLSKDAYDIVNEFMPNSVKPGDTLRSIFKANTHQGFLELMRTAISRGSGSWGFSTKVSKRGAIAWKTVKDKLLYWIPKIRHWKIFYGDYTELPNYNATWYIDPPYSSRQGRVYRIDCIDYGRLLLWVRSRSGFVIVCENVDAKWLDFKKLTAFKGHNSCRYYEGIYTQGG